MGYRVEFVGDGELPEEQRWVMARTPEDCVLIIEASCVTPAILEEAWLASEMLAPCPPPRHDLQPAACARPYVPGFGLTPREMDSITARLAARGAA